MRYTDKLGDLQTKILKHILSCKSDAVETVSHISKEVAALQPDVFRSTKIMIEEGILVKKTTSKSNMKELILTDKGIAIAVLAGIKDKKLTDYLGQKPENFQNVYDRERHKLFGNIIQIAQDSSVSQGFLFKRALDYMVKNRWYDEGKKILDEKEKILLFTELIPHILTDASQFSAIPELLDMFGINKDVFGDLLFQRVISTTNNSIKAQHDYHRYIQLNGVAESYILDKALLKKWMDQIDELDALVIFLKKTAEKMEERTQLLENTNRLHNKEESKLLPSIKLIEEDNTLAKMIATASETPNPSTLYKNLKSILPKTFPDTILSVEVSVNPKKIHRKILEKRIETGKTKLSPEIIKMILSELRSSQPLTTEEPLTRTRKRENN